MARLVKKLLVTTLLFTTAIASGMHTPEGNKSDKSSSLIQRMANTAHNKAMATARWSWDNKGWFAIITFAHFCGQLKTANSHNLWIKGCYTSEKYPCSKDTWAQQISKKMLPFLTHKQLLRDQDQKPLLGEPTLSLTWLGKIFYWIGLA